MSLKSYFLNLSLNEKLIGMMLFLSLILISILLFLYSRSETTMLAELEKQTAELSKAIQVGVEEVTSTGFTDQMKLYHYLQELKAKGVKEISIISNTDEIIASTNPTKVGEVEHLCGIAQVARGIAHEIRNPLNFLSLSIDHLKEKYIPVEKGKKEKFESLIASIKKEIESINKLAV